MRTNMGTLIRLYEKAAKGMTRVAMIESVSAGRPKLREHDGKHSAGRVLLNRWVEGLASWFQALNLTALALSLEE